MNPDIDQRQCYPSGEYLRGQDLIDFVRSERGNTVLLSFSTGKDSLASWLYLREHGFEIVPYFLYLVPGLRFQEMALEYYEQFFGQHIIRLPYPGFYWRLTHFCWQPPETVATIKALDLPNYTYATVDELVAIEFELDEPFCAVGIRMKDNLQRRRLVKQMGVVGIGPSANRRWFYPIWDWDVNQVGEIIKAHGVKLPPEYHLFGRTVMALHYRRLVKIRDHYPDDYATILEWFPLVDLEIFRYEQVGRHGKS